MKSQLSILLFLSDGLSFSGQYYSYTTIYKGDFGLSQGSIRVLLNRLKHTGLIEKILKNDRVQFRLTTQGTDRIKRVLCLEQSHPKWDRKWRIFVAKKGRVNLKKFGFVRIQRSVYISPFNFPEKNVLNQGFFFETQHILAISNEKLVQLVWTVDRLNKRYLDWITRAQEITKGNLGRIIFEYQDIVAQDPFLPTELLPKEWHFERAREKLIQLAKRHFSTRKM